MNIVVTNIDIQVKQFLTVHDIFVVHIISDIDKLLSKHTKYQMCQVVYSTLFGFHHDIDTKSKWDKKGKLT